MNPTDSQLKDIAEKFFYDWQKTGDYLDSQKWPYDPGKAFDDLDQKEQDVLTSLAKGKVPPAYDEALEHLKSVGWIQENQNGKNILRQFSNPPLKQFILYNRTGFAGRLRLLYDKPLRRIKSEISPIQGFRLFIALGFVCFFLPLILATWLAHPGAIESILQNYQQFLDLIKNKVLLNFMSEAQLNHIPNLLIFLTFCCGVYVVWQSLAFEEEKRLKLLSITLVAAILTFLPWLGVSFPLAFLLFIFITADFMALYSLHNAYNSAISYKDRPDFEAPYKFLAILMTRETWTEFKHWPRPKIIVFVILFLTGFSLFIYALTPAEITLKTPDDFLEAKAFYPAWFSEGDNGNLLVQLNNLSTQPLTVTFNIEPIPGQLLVITPQEGNNCHSVCQITVPANNQTLLQWKIHSVPQNAFVVETKWRIRYQICKDPSFCTNFTDEQQLIVPKLRLGFGLWSVLENQPLVFIMSVVSGLVYAMAEIGLGSRIIQFSDKEEVQNNKQTGGKVNAS